MKEPKRTCPPPTPWDEIKVGDDIEYQRERRDVESRRSRVVAKDAETGELMLADMVLLSQSSSTYVRVLSSEGPSVRKETKAKTKAKKKPGFAPMAAGSPWWELRRAFCVLVASAVDTKGMLLVDAFEEVRKRPEFAELSNTALSTYYSWRDRMGPKPRTNVRREAGKKTGKGKEKEKAEGMPPAAKGPQPLGTPGLKEWKAGKPADTGRDEPATAPPALPIAETGTELDGVDPEKLHWPMLWPGETVAGFVDRVISCGWVLDYDNPPENVSPDLVEMIKGELQRRTCGPDPVEVTENLDAGHAPSATVSAMAGALEGFLRELREATVTVRRGEAIYRMLTEGE